MRIFLKKINGERMSPLDPDARGKTLRVVDISGGEGVRRRLFSLGFQPGDLIVCGSRGILGGPVVLKNVTTGVAVAIGRGIARKIVVAIHD
jgi:Fe2+ transport system protein FeoA